MCSRHFATGHQRRTKATLLNFLLPTSTPLTFPSPRRPFAQPAQAANLASVGVLALTGLSLYSIVRYHVTIVRLLRRPVLSSLPSSPPPDSAHRQARAGGCCSSVHLFPMKANLFPFSLPVFLFPPLLFVALSLSLLPPPPAFLPFSPPPPSPF